MRTVSGKVRPLLVALQICFLASGLALGQSQGQKPTTLNAYMNEAINARVNQRNNVSQTEAPSAADNSTSLVDQSSASDLLSVAANLAGLTGTSSGQKADSVSVTASLYSLYALVEGENPMNFTFYNQNRNWRRVSFTLGYDDKKPNGGQAVERTSLAGLKFLIFNRRDVAYHPEKVKKITGLLTTATATFGQVSERVRFAVFANEKVRNLIVVKEFIDYLRQKRAPLAAARGASDAEVVSIDRLIQDVAANPSAFFGGANTARWSDYEKEFFRQDFSNKYFEKGFDTLLKTIGPDGEAEIGRIVEENINPFLVLDDEAMRAYQDIKRAPQFSISFLSKTRKDGPDEYLASAIFEYGVAGKLDFTINGTFNYKDSKVIGGDLREGKFSAQLRFQLNDERRLTDDSKAPWYFTTAAEGKWTPGMDSTIKAQAKLTVPIKPGIDFPILFTYANRTELIDERDVRGQVGFTFDIAKLAKSLLLK